MAARAAARSGKEDRRADGRPWCCKEHCDGIQPVASPPRLVGSPARRRELLSRRLQPAFCSITQVKADRGCSLSTEDRLAGFPCRTMCFCRPGCMVTDPRLDQDNTGKQLTLKIRAAFAAADPPGVAQARLRRGRRRSNGGRFSVWRREHRDVWT